MSISSSVQYFRLSDNITVVSDDSLSKDRAPTISTPAYVRTAYSYVRLHAVLRRVFTHNYKILFIYLFIYFVNIIWLHHSVA